MTVGECGGVTTEFAKQLANEEGTELGMVFQFEHVALDCNGAGKWCKMPFPIKALKENLTKWQKELDGFAWNSLFMGNHDQPRINSRLGDESALSAKAIAVMLYSMQGTPYLYQGEELGMTNYPFKGIEDYNDIESINAFHQLVDAGYREPEELLVGIAYKSRDNARTPMQWSAEENAGFTTGKPWFTINPNYTTINAVAQVNDPQSVYSFYKEYLHFRKDPMWKEVMVYGTYELLDPDHEAVYAYTREAQSQKLLVVCNMSARDQVFEAGEVAGERKGEKALISNYSDSALAGTLMLRPWEASIFDISHI